jgi:large conductance mechanosensitive channel
VKGYLNPARWYIMDMVNTEDTEEELRNDVLELGKDARGFEEEFVEFLKKNQVIGLAVAFIIGTAATALVTALVKDIVMPVVGVILPGGNWQTALLPVGPINFIAGDFVGAMINFIIIALVVFMLVKYIMKADMSKKV